MNLIGILQEENTIDSFVNHLAEETQNYGLSLIVFTLEDLDLEEGLVNGKVHKEGDWHLQEVPIPLFIDVSPSLFKTAAKRSTLKKLRKYAKLSATVRFPLLRSRYHRYFKQGSYFYERVIFREKVQTIEEVEQYVKEHDCIRVTPIGKRKERMIFTLTDRLNIYREEDQKLLSHDYTVLTPYLNKKGFYLERFIPSITDPLQEMNGYAHFEKGGEGKWVLIQTKVQSTVTLDEYYSKNYEEESEELLTKAEEELYRFAKGVEISRKREFIDLIVHFVIDQQGKLHFRHVTKNIHKRSNQMQEIIKLRAAYYAFKAEALRIKEIKSPEELIQRRLENNQIEESLIQYQEEEERKRKLIEQGILKPEKKQWTTFGILVIIALIFALSRYVLRVFM